jgi:hypothetical protein
MNKACSNVSLSNFYIFYEFKKLESSYVKIRGNNYLGRCLLVKSLSFYGYLNRLVMLNWLFYRRGLTSKSLNNYSNVTY